MNQHTKLLFIFLLFTLAFGCTNNHNTPATTLWYNTPLNTFASAFPVGNGDCAAILYDSASSDMIELSQNAQFDQFHTTDSLDGINVSQSIESFMQTRKLIQNQEYIETLNKVSSYWQGKFLKFYNPFCKLYITNNTQGHITNYYRDLNIANAVATLSYNKDNAYFKREVFVSYPDRIICIHFESDSANSLDITLNPVLLDSSQKMEMLTVFPKQKGIIEKSIKGTRVSATHEFYILIALGTESSTLLAEASQINYSTLKTRHENDFRIHFNRIYFHLNTFTDNSKLPLNQRIKQFSKNNDYELLSTLFQYGRYLMISGSRPYNPLEKTELYNIRHHTQESITEERNIWTGFTSGISELLIKADSNNLQLLPNLPQQWHRGELRGITTANGFEVNLKWNDNKFSSATILSKQGKRCSLLTHFPFRIREIGKATPVVIDGEHLYQLTFSTTVGEEYKLE